MRLLVYDRTCVRTGGRLSPVWASGATLYRALGRIDASHGAESWADALAWIAAQEAPITELQYWGHGKWGCAFIDRDVLDAGRLPELAVLRERLAPDALVWFRTCETFGARRGQDFASRLADFLGARVAGHTHVIGFHQSGLHGLVPGARPHWSAAEGVAEGTPEAPVSARSSRPWAPHTITALRGAVPADWFTSRS